MKNLNLANLLSLSRVLFGIIIFIMFFYIANSTISIFTILILHIIILIIFLLAIISDLLDGYFARKRDEVTDLGKHLDPLTDSFFFIILFFAFVYLKIMPWYFFLIVLARESFMHLFLRPYYKKKKSSLPANIYGKIKTLSQSIFSTIILILLIAKDYLLFIKFPEKHITLFDSYFIISAFFFFAIIAFLSLLSIIIYIIDFKKSFKF